MIHADTELILNEDGSIYHLGLRTGDLAEDIILVGDQERVSLVSEHFDNIELKKGNREFVTHTGTLGGRRISVVSTGIGTDNVDIVLNEIHALFHFDFQTRKKLNRFTKLRFIRIGTSGSVQADIHPGTLLATEYSIGLDGLIHYYDFYPTEKESELASSFKQKLNWNNKLAEPYCVEVNRELLEGIAHDMMHGITITTTGFYGPQNRQLNLALHNEKVQESFTLFSYEDKVLTNLEMETSGIYGLAKLLGHDALSCSAILANRINGEFADQPQEVIEKLISTVLRRIVEFNS